VSRFVGVFQRGLIMANSNLAGSSVDELCDALETKLSENEVCTSESAPAVGTKGWEELIPLFLQFLKIIRENRKKPAPAPTP
jgi:hypothetical protein